jgi:hypothetical protein
MELSAKVLDYQDIINVMLSKQDKLLMVLPRLIKKVIGKQCYIKVGIVWTSLGPLPRWVPEPTTRWAPGTTQLVPHDT